MGRLLIYETISRTSPLSIEKTASRDVTERILRRACAWTILVFLILGELGLGWDIQWHALVGRDRFWTPPHILIYTAVGGAGLVSLFMVLLDTLRYRRKAPGVDDSSTITVLRVFHAPLGFIVCGAGPLICLIAAPFDNYWHQLYGIDITLWSPFHLMGAIGGILTAFGLVYAFASEVAIERHADRAPRTFLGLTALEWGALILLAALLRLTLSALTQFPGFALGPVELLTYPLPLALGAGLCIVSTLRFTRRPGAATILGLLTVLHTLISEAFVPWAVRVMVIRMGLTYRFPGRLPFFNLTATLLSLTFVVAGLLIDIIVFGLRRADSPGWLLGMLAALPAVIVAPLIIVTTVNLLPAGIVYMPAQALPPLLATLPLVLAVGALAGVPGEKLGKTWYENRR
jgi:hypothetical protein